jgi:hypothetical protein
MKNLKNQISQKILSLQEQKILTYSSGRKVQGYRRKPEADLKVQIVNLAIKRV